MRIIIVSLVVLAALVLAFYFGFIRPLETHRRVVERIDHVIYRNSKSPPRGLDENSWHNYYSAPHNALFNFFISPKYYPTPKLEIMAVHFETTWPNGPKTTHDVLGMIDVMVAANPGIADYGPFQEVRRMIEEAESAPPTPGRQ